MADKQPNLDDVLVEVAALARQLEARTFASGKEGFFAQAKLVIGGKRYQSQIMLVEIQPK